MASYRTAEFRRALLRKGFKEDPTHHLMFWYYLDGKKTSLRTRYSNGERTFEGDLVTFRRQQMGSLTEQQLSDFIQCPFTAEQYQKHLLAKGLVKKPAADESGEGKKQKKPAQKRKKKLSK